MKNIINSLILTFILSTIIACGNSVEKNTAKYNLSNIKSTILGGTKVEGDEYNYVVAITRSDKGVFCSGSIINGNTILTSAHCLNNKNIDDLTVYVGNGDPRGFYLGQWEVKEAFQHPMYDPQKPSHDDTNPDLAILKLNDNLDDYYDINYPELVLDAKKMESLAKKDTTSTHIGFGRRLADKSHPDYDTKYGEKYFINTPIKGTFPESLFTGGDNKGPYKGDSGSPLIVKIRNKHYVVGVAKYAREDGHSFSIKTSYGADFIKKHM